MPLPREASALPTDKEEVKIIFNDHISIMFLTFGRVISLPCGSPWTMGQRNFGNNVRYLGTTGSLFLLFYYLQPRVQNVCCTG